MQSYSKIIVPLNEINSITEALPQVEKRSILREHATKLQSLVKDARQWTFTLEKERSDLEKQVLELRQELARIQGEENPDANDRYTPDFRQYCGGTAGKKE